MFNSPLFKDCPGSKQGESSDALVDIVFLAIDSDLFISAFFFLFAHAFIELDGWNFEEASVNTIELISDAFVNSLLK